MIENIPEKVAYILRKCSVYIESENKLVALLLIQLTEIIVQYTIHLNDNFVYEFSVHSCILCGSHIRYFHNYSALGLHRQCAFV